MHSHVNCSVKHAQNKTRKTPEAKPSPYATHMLLSHQARQQENLAAVSSEPPASTVCDMGAITICKL